MHNLAQNDNLPNAQKAAKTHGSDNQKAALLQTLRQTVSKLEARSDAYALPEAEKKEEYQEVTTERPEFPAGWAHEIWAERPDDFTPAMAYALAGLGASDGTILWVTSPRMVQEHGLPYGPGLKRFGIDPARLVIVRARDRLDALWAVEEGLKSQKLAAVVGEVEGIDLTESRRLSLTTRERMTRCILILRSEKAPSSASYSRVALRAHTSEPPHFAAHAPGESRAHANLVKHRGGKRPHDHVLEWTHAPDNFPVAAPMADRPLQPREQQHTDRAVG